MKVTQINGEHLICLSEREALLLLRLLQPSLLHEANQREWRQPGEAAHFHRSLTQALLHRDPAATPAGPCAGTLHQVIRPDEP